MDLDGSNPKHRTGGGGWAAGPEWVVYAQGNARWKAPLNGGEPVRICEGFMARCAASHDGMMLACSQETPGEPAKLAGLPIDGCPPRVFDAKFQLPARMRWTPDGRAVTYIGRQDGLADIWSQPLDGGEPKRITNFKSDTIFSFDWSRDNKLVISHGTSAADVVLLRNHK